MPVPPHYSKLCDVVKKAVNDKLGTKVNGTDSSEFIPKNKHQTDKTELENKISYVSDLAKKSKLTELENKIPDFSGLPEKSALTVVKNKILDVSN